MKSHECFWNFLDSINNCRHFRGSQSTVAQVMSLSQFSSLIFLSPTIEPLGFWEVLWAVGITNFIIKFLFMGIKCLILLLPFSVVTYRVQVRLVDLFTADLSLKMCLFSLSFFFFHIVLLFPGTVSDADRRAGSDPPGHGSSFSLVPLLGFIRGSWGHPWAHTGNPASTALPHHEGAFTQNQEWWVFA